MKRILAALLAALLLFGLFGCHDTTGQAPEETAPVVEATAAPTDTPAPTEAPTPTPEPTPEPTKSPAEIWAAFDAQYPAKRSAVSLNAAMSRIWDPSAFDIDPDSLPIIAEGTIEESIRYYASLRQLLNEVTALDASAFDEKDKLAYDTVTESLKATLKQADFLLCENPFAPGEGWHVSLPGMLCSVNIRSEEDVQRYLKLLSYMPEFLDKLLAREQQRIDNGMFMTASALDQTLEEIDGVRKEGENFFAYTSLADYMTGIGMTAEQQEPYLAQNKTAVDALLAAYDKLYTALSGMRGHCEKEASPYADPNKYETTEWYRYFLSKLTEVAGTGEGAQRLDAVIGLYDAASQYLSNEYAQMDLPEDLGTQLDNYEPKSVEQYYTETIAALEELFGPLSVKPEPVFLPDMQDDLFGNMKARYFYDAPEHSVTALRDATDDVAMHAIHAACFDYLHRYSFEHGVSRAQILEAPGTYYSGMSLLLAMHLLKKNALRTGEYAEWYNVFMTVYNYVLCGYTAGLIAHGFDQKDIMDDLTQYYGMPQAYAEQIYQTARNSPFTCLEISFGFTSLYLQRQACRTKLGGQMDDQMFLAFLLDCGPAFPVALNDPITAWADGIRNGN